MTIETRGGRFRARVRRRGAPDLSATFGTEVEAVAWEAAVLAALATGHEVPAPPRPERASAAPPRPVTVLEASRELVTGMRSGAVRDRRGRRYKPSTVREIERRLRLHVLPSIGAVPLAALRRGDVRRLVDDLTVEATPATARNALDALRLVVRLQLERENGIEVNICQGVRVPAPERRPPRVLSRDEMRRLQEAADADDHPFIGPFVALALATGARKGELRALRWGPDGLDLGAGLVTIAHTLDAVEGPVETKNREDRQVPLGPGIVARMRRYLLACGRPADGSLVFPGAEPKGAWWRARTAAALDDPQPVMHDLRHAYCSAMRAAGLESHEVAALVGHSDGGRLVDTLYAHPLAERLAGAGTRLEAFLAGAEG